MCIRVYVAFHAYRVAYVGWKRDRGSRMHRLQARLVDRSYPGLPWTIIIVHGRQSDLDAGSLDSGLRVAIY